MLIVTLSNQGHWFGGVEETVTVQWANTVSMPQAVVLWQLSYGEVVFKSGQFELNDQKRSGKLALTLPEVRVPTTMQFSYRLQAVDGRKTLAEGKLPLHVYPTNLLDGVGRRLGKKRLVVWDTPEGIPAALNRFKIPHQRIDDDSQLTFSKADIVLVGEDRIPASPFGQTALLDMIKAGANVLILCQKKPPRLAGYPLVRRAAPKKLQWKTNHPLNRRLLLSDPASGQHDLWAVRLPADEPVLEIAYWPREQPGKQPVPIDALVAIKKIGRGRLVLCQVPLGSWERDPRSQLFLSDAIDYLTSPVEPTLRPSHRHHSKRAAIETLPPVTTPILP